MKLIKKYKSGNSITKANPQSIFKNILYYSTLPYSYPIVNTYSAFSKAYKSIKNNKNSKSNIDFTEIAKKYKKQDIFDNNNLNKTLNFLRKNNYSIPQIAGIMGNILIETGGNTKYADTSSTFRGIVQWHKSQKEAGLFNSSLESQLNYLHKDIQRNWPTTKKEKYNGWDPRYFEKWNTSGLTAGQYGEIFDIGYERSDGSSRAQRISAANDIYNLLVN